MRRQMALRGPAARANGFARATDVAQPRMCKHECSRATNVFDSQIILNSFRFEASFSWQLLAHKA